MNLEVLVTKAYVHTPPLYEIEKLGILYDNWMVTKVGMSCAVDDMARRFQIVSSGLRDKVSGFDLCRSEN
jgi:hypothetical protein